MLPSSPILVAPGLAGGAVARNLGRECLLVWTITLHSDLGAMPCTADTVCIGWLLCLTCRAVPHPGSAVLRGLMALRRVRPVWVPQAALSRTLHLDSLQRDALQKLPTVLRWTACRILDAYCT